MNELPTIDVSIELPFIDTTIGGVWRPNDLQRAAAWELCVELCTRVPVIPLREREGLLGEALGSMHTVFGATREILRRHGPALADSRPGELSFAVLAGHLLNQLLRPVTAYWHPRHEGWMGGIQPGQSKLEREREWPDEARLRAVLQDLRKPLVDFTKVFARASSAEEFVRVQLDNEDRLYSHFARVRASGTASPSR